MSVPPGARVSIFLGKGGVGKTTLAAAFAAERAAAGERVLLTSFTSAEDLRHRVTTEGPGEVALGGRLAFLTLEPRKLVDDIVRKITRLGAMADLVTRQAGYESLVDIAPGVKEMAVFNLVWNERQKGYGGIGDSSSRETGVSRYDRVVVDGPATGHGLHFLEAPDKTADILVGKLKERALAIRDLLRDPAATEAVIVTLPEETPVRETIELARKLAQGGFPLDNVVVNKWLPRVFETRETAAVLSTLESDEAARRALAARLGSAVDLDAWIPALALIRAQRREAVEHVGALAGLGAKLSLVPYYPDADARLARVAQAMRAPFRLEEARAA